MGQLFHSGFTHRSRGVAILIHKKVPFNPIKVIEDSQGLYVIVLGSLYFFFI